jgi:hypothetical protein
MLRLVRSGNARPGALAGLAPAAGPRQGSLLAASGPVRKEQWRGGGAAGRRGGGAAPGSMELVHEEVCSGDGRQEGVRSATAGTAEDPRARGLGAGHDGDRAPGRAHRRDYTLSPKLAINLMAVMLGRNTYAAALVVMKLERPVTSIGGPPFACGMTKMLSAGFWVPISGSFDFG